MSLFCGILYPVNPARQVFDLRAAIYDDLFAGSQIRSEIWKIADRFILPGMHLLDLGCGTGDDAVHFARRSVRVTAVDVSPAMIARLKLKCDQMIHCEEADMRTYCPGGLRFDSVFSNLSALNYVSDLSWLSRLCLSAGSHVVLTTLGRFYPLESLIFLAKGKPRLAFHRFGRLGETIIDGMHFNIYYHSIRAIQDALGPKFELKELTGLRCLRPIRDLEHLERFRMIRLMKPLDRWLCSHRLTAVCSDQFVSVWQYHGTLATSRHPH